MCCQLKPDEVAERVSHDILLDQDNDVHKLLQGMQDEVAAQTKLLNDQNTLIMTLTNENRNKARVLCANVPTQRRTG